MKNFTRKYVSRLLFALFGLMLFQSAIAQSNSYLSWNNQVGCISYGSTGNPSNPNLTESVQSSPCVQVCESSNVVYTVNGSNVVSVQWTVAGGTLTTSGTNGTTGTVNWGSRGSGLVEVLITYPNNITRRVSQCIEIINKPVPNFNFYGPASGGNFCLNSAVNFKNLSLNNGGSDIVNYAWDFGDGNYSTAFEPTHNYTQPGAYPVKLTVTNNCGCSTTFVSNVNISNGSAAVINHPGVICQNNQVHTYTAVSACGGDWSVIGGTAISSTGTTVNVIWNSVDADGFGYLSYRSSCTCSSWSTTKIPVIKTTGTIDGPATLCLNEQGVYTLPQWPGTLYTWTLDPSSSNTIIASGQRNEVLVNALSPGQYTLKANYINTITGCSGNASLVINVLKSISISGPASLCSGTATSYSSSMGSVNWVLRKGSTTVATSTGTTFSNAFSAAGVYILSASSPSYCSAQKVITVEQTPTTPTGSITGEATVCPGQPYQYTFNNTEANTIPVWSVTNGTIQGANTGNTITVVFNANATSYGIAVQRRSTGPLGCTSSTLAKTVSPLLLTPTITSTSGATSFCPSSQSTFTVNLSGITPDLIEWTLPPALGSIVSGVNAATVTVNWNSPTGSQATGALQVRVKKCNPDVYATFNVAVLQNPLLTLTGPESLCAVDALNLTLSAAPAITSGTIIWNFGNGTTTTTSVNTSGNYTFLSPYNSSTTSPNANYAITASINSPNGCGILRASTTIIAYPKKVVTITPGSSFIVCPATYRSLTLYSNSGSGITAAASYKWYKNGTLISGTGAATYTITGSTPGGNYYVRVTDINGCVSQSQTVRVQEDCTGGGDNGGGECFPSPSVSLTGTWAECDKLLVSYTYTGAAPTSVQWLGSQFISLSSTGTNSAYFTSFDQNPIIPGVHIVTLKLVFPTCIVTRSVAITKNYTPDFVSTIACNSGTNLTYNVTLQNNSTIFNTPAIPINYAFSGTGIITPITGQSATLTNLAPGTYNYYITVSSTAPGKPSCSVMKTLVLPALPALNFTLPNVNYCAQEPITLTIPNYNPAYNYSWHFAGNVVNATGATTVVNINTAGTFPITLQSTTAFGCTISSSPVNVTINKQVFNGSLSANPSVICVGTQPVITYAPGTGATPSGYIWMNGTQQVATTTVPTYSPTVTGTYWVKLVGTGGCAYPGLGNASVTVLALPFAGITGSSAVCSGNTTTLQGNVMSNNVERRWLLNGSPITGAAGTWTAATAANLLYTTPVLATGTYSYTLEVRYISGSGCTGTATIPVSVLTPTATPALSYSIMNCEPYKVKISVTNPVSGGIYNWSNGAIGTSITVNDGGAYMVSYTGPSGGCASSASITVPHPLSLDLPTGGYDFCLNATPIPFVVGPVGIVSTYQWLLNGQVVAQGGNSTVPNIQLNQEGSYQLIVKYYGCEYESGIITVDPADSCNPLTPACKLSVVDDSVVFINGHYEVTLTLRNGDPYPVTVSLSSLNGSYNPSTISLPAPINGIAQPVTATFIFTPNFGFDGGDDTLAVESADCNWVFTIKFPSTEPSSTARRAAAKPAGMRISPNPADDYATIKYDLGSEYTQAEKLTVYSLLGEPLITQNLEQLSGEVKIATSHLPSGAYLISIEANGIKALHKTLIKK